MVFDPTIKEQECAEAAEIITALLSGKYNGTVKIGEKALRFIQTNLESIFDTNADLIKKMLSTAVELQAVNLNSGASGVINKDKLSKVADQLAVDLNNIYLAVGNQKNNKAGLKAVDNQKNNDVPTTKPKR